MQFFIYFSYSLLSLSLSLSIYSDMLKPIVLGLKTTIQWIHMNIWYILTRIIYTVGQWVNYFRSTISNGCNKEIDRSSKQWKTYVCAVKWKLCRQKKFYESASQSRHSKILRLSAKIFCCGTFEKKFEIEWTYFYWFFFWYWNCQNI